MKASLQEVADSLLAPEYRQTLKTPVELAIAMGWGNPDTPTCCGERVHVVSFVGCPHQAECKKCGALAIAIDGPSFENGTCRLLDPEKIDLEAPAKWAIIRPALTRADAQGGAK